MVLSVGPEKVEEAFSFLEAESAFLLEGEGGEERAARSIGLSYSC